MCTFYSATNTGIPTLNSKILIFKFNYTNLLLYMDMFACRGDQKSEPTCAESQWQQSNIMACKANCHSLPCKIRS